MMKLLGTTVTAVFAAATFGIHSPEKRAAPSSPLIVHEWGTITTQDTPSGASAGCLNRVANYEPLPAFVHHFEPQSGGVSIRVPLEKTATGACRRDITMRLETPVIYFHAPRGQSIPPFDVSVDFHGGILNEFYPNASASANQAKGQFLSESVTGSLRWSGVTLRDHVTPPETNAHVWLAPRTPAASPLTVGAESEQYLFYRGMANLPAPLRTQVTRDAIRILPPANTAWLDSLATRVGETWLVDVRPDHRIAFRMSAPLTLNKADLPTHALAELKDFASGDYTTSGLDRLRASLHDALVARGLYDDEATAMLDTWSGSYFMNPGLRLFYLVPSEWTSHYLPLRISVPNTLTRVIVGRIELSGEPTP